MDNIDTIDTMNDQSYTQASKTDAFCLSGLISSIVSLVCCCGTLSLVSLVLSIVGVAKVKKNGQSGFGMGLAGIIISGVSIIILILVILFVIIPMIFFIGLIGSITAHVIKDGAYLDISRLPQRQAYSAVEKYDINSIDDLKDFLEDKGVTFEFKS